MSLPPHFDLLLAAGLASTQASSVKAAWVPWFERAAERADSPTGPANARGYSEQLRDRILGFVGTGELHDITGAQLLRRIDRKVKERAAYLQQGTTLASSVAHAQALEHHNLRRVPDREIVTGALKWARLHVAAASGSLSASSCSSGLPVPSIDAYPAGTTSRTT